MELSLFFFVSFHFSFAVNVFLRNLLAAINFFFDYGTDVKKLNSANFKLFFGHNLASIILRIRV